MTLIDFDKKELLDISHALLSYRTDSTVIRGGGLTDEQKERYKRLASLIEKVSQLRNVCDCGGKSCLLYTSPSPRDCRLSRMPSSA